MNKKIKIINRHAVTGRFGKREAGKRQPATSASRVLTLRSRTLVSQRRAVPNTPPPKSDTAPRADQPLVNAISLLRLWRIEDAREQRDADDLPTILNAGRSSGRKPFDE